MASIDCSACEDLVNESPAFAENGVTTAVCNSLKNDTGFSSGNGNNDCEDLDTANDCLIGMMDGEIEKYEPCDWQVYMHKFVPNLHQLLKAMICAICGLWTNIHALWNRVNDLLSRMTSVEGRLTTVEDNYTTLNGKYNTLKGRVDGLESFGDRIDCLIDFLSSGHSFSFSEYDTDNASHIVAGKGVSFLNVSQSGTSADILIRYIAGGMATLTGSLLFYTQDFTDGAACYNYDTNGVDPRNPTTSRKGNSVWDNDPGKPISGGELAYEIRLKKSQYPQIANLYSGLALEGAGGGYHARILVTNAGKFAFGQHGECNVNTGNGVNGGDDGHIVPPGWIYIQMRISYIHQIIGTAAGKQYSPYGLLPIRIDADEITC